MYWSLPNLQIYMLLLKYGIFGLERLQLTLPNHVLKSLVISI